MFLLSVAKEKGVLVAGLGLTYIGQVYTCNNLSVAELFCGSHSIVYFYVQLCVVLCQNKA